MRQVEQHIASPWQVVDETIEQKERRIEGVVRSKSNVGETRRTHALPRGKSKRERGHAVRNVIKSAQGEESEQFSLGAFDDVPARHPAHGNDAARKQSKSDGSEAILGWRE